jgi:hypothetical protein
MFAGFIFVPDSCRIELPTAKVECHSLDDGCARVDADDYITLTTHD